MSRPDEVAAWVREHRRYLALAAAALFGAFFACFVLAKTTSLFPEPPLYDIQLTLSARTRHLTGAETFLARPRAVLPTMAILIVAGYRFGGRRWAVMCAATPLVVVFTTIGKTGIGQPTSLPSGHTAYATAVFGMAALLAAVTGRRASASVLALIGIAMSPARVIEGAHTVPDVLAGDALAIAWLMLILLVGSTWPAVRGGP